jgi:hypothetical protein
MKRTALLGIGLAAATTVALTGTATASAPGVASHAAKPNTVAAGHRTPSVAGATALLPDHRMGNSHHITVVADHLRNPRGLVLAPGGHILLVSEAGKGGSGPCKTDPEDPTSQVCLGLSSALTAVILHSQHRLATGLPSLAAPDGSGAIGMDNVTLTPFGLLGIVGLGADPGVRPSFGNKGRLLGHLVAVRPGNHQVPLVDVSAFEAAHNPDAADPGSAVDSDPYDVLWTHRGLFVADAGGNDVLSIDRRGHIHVVAVLHARMVDAPPFLGLPPGTQIPMQAVPDALTEGPDGALYVGELTGFPFPVGAANVYRIRPGHQPTVYASGFTNIIDVAFDRHGNLYVLEIAKNSLLSNSPVGALIKVDRWGHRHEIAKGKLMAPGGMAIASDGSIYVSVNSISGTDGQVVRIRP